MARRARSWTTATRSCSAASRSARCAGGSSRRSAGRSEAPAEYGAHAPEAAGVHRGARLPDAVVGLGQAGPEWATRVEDADPADHVSALTAHHGLPRDSAAAVAPADVRVGGNHWGLDPAVADVRVGVAQLRRVPDVEAPDRRG